jgi:hypothetical protein
METKIKAAGGKSPPKGRKTQGKTGGSPKVEKEQVFDEAYYRAEWDKFGLHGFDPRQWSPEGEKGLGPNSAAINLALRGIAQLEWDEENGLLEYLVLAVTEHEERLLKIAGELHGCGGDLDLMEAICMARMWDAKRSPEFEARLDWRLRSLPGIAGEYVLDDDLALCWIAYGLWRCEKLILREFVFGEGDALIEAQWCEALLICVAVLEKTPDGIPPERKLELVKLASQTRANAYREWVGCHAECRRRWEQVGKVAPEQYGAE